MPLPLKLQAIIDRLLGSLTPEERAGTHPPGFLFTGPDPIPADEAPYGQDAPERPEWMTSQEQGWNPRTARRIN